MPADTDPPPPKSTHTGIIAWMVGNRVTPNLIMIFLMVGGLFMTTRIKKEVFPEFETDTVSVSVSLPGGSPEEVEQGVVLVAEEAIRGIEGVKEVTATAREGSGSVQAEMLIGADRTQVYQDIKQAIDRITTFPEQSERPNVTLNSRRNDVVDLEIYGGVSERVLREVVESIRDRLLQSPGISQVDIDDSRAPELAVEIPEATLRRYGLSLEEVARRINQASVESGGGRIETSSGEILLRVDDRRESAREYADTPVVTTPEGTVLTLGQIGTVREGFEDTNKFARFDGKRSMGLDVFRIGTETPIGVSDAVKDLLPEIRRDLPPGVEIAIRIDDSDTYRQRLSLLLKNAFFGFLLVLLVLGLFLEFKLAFWVTMGIPISFLGGMLFLPFFGVSINMISMFAFIVALGIVVDDAIVAGENIYEARERGLSNFDAAVVGARGVSLPIAFSILTNVVAFLPLLFVPGVSGKIWAVIPTVVITVFLISWIESLLILPSHLAHTRSRPGNRLTARLHGWQQAFARRVRRFIETVYEPFLERTLRWRGVTVAAGLGTLLITLAYVQSGRIGVIFMPRVEADEATVTARLPLGSPLANAETVERHLIEAGERVIAEHGGDQLGIGVASSIDENSIDVRLYLQEPGVRPISTGEVTELWRQATGTIPGVESLRFESDRGGPGSGAGLSVELSHRDTATLDRAATALASRLEQFPAIKDLDSGYSPGKRQFEFQIKPAGESLGLTSRDIARQVRNSFFGAEALRQQRGRNEIKVMVRLPASERTSEYDLDRLLISTPGGTFVPLAEVATIERGRSYRDIQRRDGRRTTTVSADVDPIGETSVLIATLDATVLPQLARDFPGLSYGYEGRQADQADSLSSLQTGFLLALMLIYFLLAVPFRSYTQPLIVMISIPFGIIGAVLGHIIMGYNISMISIMGIIALAGVVVNDSLVLIDYANRLRREGQNPWDAIRNAGVRRFRPIILTTLTTFGGLAPMIFETSRQARFIIPMAISLGFGILFATVITLVLVPSLYLMIEDVTNLFRARPHRLQSSKNRDPLSA
jgi:multidrug efflux pump subunit AcrB